MKDFTCEPVGLTSLFPAMWGDVAPRVVRSYQQTKIEILDIFSIRCSTALRITPRMLPMTYPIDHTPPGFWLFFVLFDWLGVFDMKGLSFKFPSR